MAGLDQEPNEVVALQKKDAGALSDTTWLILMSLMLFLLLLPISSYVAALSLIKQEWTLSNTAAGAIYSAYLAGYVLSALLVIPLTDRIGPRNILLGSAVLSIFTHIMFPIFADDILIAVFLRAAAGVGLVGIYMPGLRLIADRFRGNRRGMAMGLYVTAQYAANSCSLALTGLLMNTFEWRDAYLFVAIGAVTGIPLAILLLRNHGQSTQGISGRLNMSVFSNASARYLILGYSLHALQLFAARVWLPVFLVGVLIGKGIDPAKATVDGATIGGLALLAGSVGPFMGGAISDRWGRSTSASLIFGLSGGCAFIIGWTTGLPLGLIFGLSVIYGWAIAADSAIYSTGIVEVSLPSTLGSTMAVQASIGLLGGVVGPIMFGGILDISPNGLDWPIAFSSLGLLAIVAICGMQRIRYLPQNNLLKEYENNPT